MVNRKTDRQTDGQRHICRLEIDRHKQNDIDRHRLTPTERQTDTYSLQQKAQRKPQSAFVTDIKQVNGISNNSKIAL